jgi:hypothetical protein
VAASPVETKTAAGASVTALTGVVTWILVTYVPAFHSGLPVPLATFLPYVIGTVAGAVAAYLAPHTTRADAVLAEAVKELEAAGVTLPKAVS